MIVAKSSEYTRNEEEEILHKKTGILANFC